MIKNVMSKVMNFSKEHAPEILIGTGVVGMATSTILAVRATPKALELMEDKKAELGVTCLTKKEVVESTWKQYVPAVGVGVLSTACIIAGTHKSLRRNAALATVYAISEGTLKEYQKKTAEIAGEEKAAEIEKEVAKARVKEQPQIVNMDDSEYITYTGNGDTLVFDSLSGRFFKSSMNSIDRAINIMNKSLMDDYEITLNDLYNELEIPTIDAGSLIGWKSDKELIDVRYDSDVDSAGRPYLILSFKNRPVALQNKYSY